MKKLITAAIVLSAAAVMLTGCSMGKDKGDTNITESQTTTSQSQTTTQSATTPKETTHSVTGDVDGDGFIEEVVTDATGMVEDIVTGAESIVGDIVDGNDTTTAK